MMVWNVSLVKKGKDEELGLIFAYEKATRNFKVSNEFKRQTSAWKQDRITAENPKLQMTGVTSCF